MRTPLLVATLFFVRSVFADPIPAVVPLGEQQVTQPTYSSNSDQKQINQFALVIGISNYPWPDNLNSPRKDAETIGKKLGSLGFQVIQAIDADRETIKKKIDEFRKALAAKRGPAVVYYSGHGIQLNGVNYLVPFDAKISGPEDVTKQAIRIDDITRSFTGNEPNVLILDACRNNPWSKEKGLAPIDAPAGTVIAFATSPGRIATDGNPGENGLYARHLLAEMDAPGLRIEDLFRKIRIGVRRESQGDQIPWESTSYSGDYYLMPFWQLLDKEYGQGFGRFKFGMSPVQINDLLLNKFGTVEWDILPQAMEYNSVEVRYFWKILADVPKLKEYGIYNPCISPSSYITFLFKDRALFRISLRFINDNSCPDHQLVLDEFAELYNVSPVVRNRHRSFKLVGREVTLVGGDYKLEPFPWDIKLRGTLIELVKKESPRYVGQDW